MFVPYDPNRPGTVYSTAEDNAEDGTGFGACPCGGEGCDACGNTGVTGP
jgi:hypothetical protein